MNVELVLPLHNSAGDVWHTVRRHEEVELPPFDDPNEELVACLPVTREVNAQTVSVELRFLAEDLEDGKLVFPLIVDPVPGGGPVVVEEVAA